MGASIVRHHRLILVALVALVCAAALLIAVTHRAPAAVSAAPAAHEAAGEAVLVVRHASGHDALWLLSPTDGAATAAGELPGLAGAAAVSPAGSVAYLPENQAPRIWIGHGPFAPRTVSLAAAGVRRIDALTWVAADRLLVSGVKKGFASPYRDRLFLVDLTTGKTRAFRGLSGAEPSAAPAVGKVAYVKFTTLVAGTKTKAPVIRESLKVLSLTHGGAGRTVWTDEYQLWADHRAFSHPQLAPDGRWFLTGETGSDVRVTYAIRDAGGNPLLTLFTVAVQAGAGWDATSTRTAFAGAVDGPGEFNACVWVYDVASGSLTRSPKGLLPQQMIGSVAWSPSGRLALGGFTATGTPAARHVYVLSAADLTTMKDAGAGELPVWVVQ
jgi:hypothetical protein